MKKLFLTIIIVLIFLILGCTQPAGEKNDIQPLSNLIENYDGSSQIDPLDTCYNKTTKIQRDLCYGNLATVKPNYIYCLKITDKKQHDFCLMTLAQLTENSKLCMESSDLNSQDECLKLFALTKNDSKLCENLTQRFKIDDCYSDFFLDTMDFNLLEQIENEYVYNETITAWALMDINSLICNMITNQESRETCYWYATSEDEEGRLELYTESINMSVFVPKTWSYIENPAELVLYVLYPDQEEDDFSENINLTTDDLTNYPTLTLNEYKSIALKNISKLIDYNLIEEQDFSSDNIEKIKYVKTETSTMLNGKNIEVYQGLFMFIANQRGFIFTYSAEKNQYYDHFTDVVELVNSAVFYEE